MSLFKCKLFIKPVCLISLIILLVGCASAPDKEAEGPLFYPPLPNPPYIQYLTSFSTIDDLKNTKSGFADFILGKESKDSLVIKPYGVAIHEGKIYAVDVTRKGYTVLDLQTRKAKYIDGGVTGRMSSPINITITPDGYKYVTDTGRSQVLLFDQKDHFVRAYGIKDQFKPSDVAVTDKKIFVADLKGHRILVLDKVLGHTVGEIGKVGKNNGEFYYPTNLFISPDNYLYVTDTGNFRVQKFTLEGGFVRSFGGLGSGLGKFARPKGISVDKTGNIYVVDAAFENVQIFNNNGKLLQFFGQAGNRPGDVNLPADIMIDYKNTSYFQSYADPRFKLEYIILVSSQFGVNKVSVYGYGKMTGMEYPADNNS